MTKVFNLLKQCGQNNNDFFIDSILQKPINNSLIADSQKSPIHQNENSEQEMNCSDQIGLTISDSCQNEDTVHSCPSKYF